MISINPDKPNKELQKMQTIPTQVFDAFKTNRGQIVDDSAHLPSLGIEALNNGGDRVLATLYGLRAFRSDIHQLKQMAVDVNDLLKVKHKRQEPKEAKALYMAVHHRLFAGLIREDVVKSRSTETLDLLNRNNVDVWLESTSNVWMFKCHETGYCCRIH